MNDRDPSPAGAMEGPPAKRTAALPARRGSRLYAIPTPIVFVVSMAAAIAILVWQGVWGDVVPRLEQVALGFLVLGMVLYGVGLVGLCWRWALLVRLAGGRRDFRGAAEAFLTSIAVNYAAPLGLAAPARAVLSVRDLGLARGPAGGVAVAEIVLDLAVLGCVSLVWLASGGAALLPRLWWTTPIVLAVGGALVLAIGMGLAMVVRRPAIRQRLSRAANGARQAVARQPRQAMLTAAMTVGYWLLQGVVLLVLLQSAGIAGDWRLVGGLLGPPIAVGMVSPVPGGAGVREALMVAVAGLRGVDAAAVLLAAVAYRVALFVALPLVFVAIRLSFRIGKRRASGERAIDPLNVMTER